MPEIVALSCPVCGAPLKPGDEKCSFCGAYIFIKSDLPKLDRHALNQSVIQEHIADFRRRVRADQYDEEAHYGLGVAYFSLGLIDHAAEELTQAARLMPENPNIQAQLAVVLHKAVRAGNDAAEEHMNARIQNALLLDPGHLEANLLKADLLMEKEYYRAAANILLDHLSRDESRVAPRAVVALKFLGKQSMGSGQWDTVRWCWTKLEPIDSEAAQQLAMGVLNRYPQLVPKTIKDSATEDQAVQPGVQPPKRIFRTFLAALGGLVVAFVLLVIITVTIAVRDSDNVMSGWEAIAFLLPWIALIVFPVLAAKFYRTRSDPRPKVERTVIRPEKVTRDHLLSGVAESSVIFGIANDVVDRLIRKGSV